MNSPSRLLFHQNGRVHTAPLAKASDFAIRTLSVNLSHFILPGLYRCPYMDIHVPDVR